ncbi:hypothetical protein BU15DRAFT_64969 [Melanogaster broomeanus]|nr:hypothetical protein BU15DRAFT_64969 [Melanogaster broomeanus]
MPGRDAEMGTAGMRGWGRGWWRCDGDGGDVGTGTGMVVVRRGWWRCGDGDGDGGGATGMVAMRGRGWWLCDGDGGDTGMSTWDIPKRRKQGRGQGRGWWRYGDADTGGPEKAKPGVGTGIGFHSGNGETYG